MSMILFLDQCKAADIVFVLDASDNVPLNSDWKDILNITMEIINYLGKSDMRYRFSVITYGASPTIPVYFKSHTKYTGVIDHVRGLQKVPGQGNLESALQFARKEVFDKIDDLPDIPNILIIVTSFIRDNDVSNVLLQADLLKRQYVQPIAIGITDSVRKETLESLTANEDSSSTKYFKVNSFDGLIYIYPQVVEAVCFKHKPVIIHKGKFNIFIKLYNII